MTEPVTREGRDFVAHTIRELRQSRGITLDADEVAGINERIRAIEAEARADALDVEAIAGIRAAALDEYVANAEPTVRRLIEAAYKKGLAEARADTLDVDALAEAIDAALVDDESGMETLTAENIADRYRAILAERQP
jgi:hypothetical protein